MDLVLYDRARAALAEAHGIDEVKDIRDKAEAMAAYARQAKDTQLIEHATEIKVRAERRAGEMLAGMDLAPGRPKKSSHDARISDLGISAGQSSRWQQVASIPEEHFEAAVQMAKNTAGEVTTAFLLREARALSQEDAPRTRPPGQLRRDMTAHYEPETERQKALANGQRLRLIDVIGTMEGCTRALAKIDLGMALAATPQEERISFAKAALTSARALRALAAQLTRSPT